MSMGINTNITAMIGQQNLSESKSALTTSMERLSSGLRINSAKDDAAGQAIANRMTSQITGLGQAQRNANDGISLAQTAEGALNQVNDNLQRVRELTVQAQNGTNSDQDLESIQNEIDQRLNEINRISEETTFNGEKVLATADNEIKIQVGAKDGEQISINLDKIDKDSLKLGNFDVTLANFDSMDVGETAIASSDVIKTGDALEIGTITDTNTGGTTTEKTNVEVYEVADPTGAAGKNYVVKDGDKFHEATVDAGGNLTYDTENGAATPAGLVASGDVDTTSGAVSQVWADSSIIEVDSTSTGDQTSRAGAELKTFDNGDDSSQAYVIEETDATTGEKTFYEVDSFDANGIAQAGSQIEAGALNKLDEALSTVDNLRSDLGAIQNRFDSAITNLSTTETNLSAARSRIEDADYATEVADMTKNQILQQAGTSVLAQANQLPQGVLSLLG